MGSKSPDTIANPPMPETALTLLEMYARNWQVQASCRCGIRLRIDLAVMIKVHGPNAIWWGKTTRCPGWECSDGRLTYSARALTGGTWRSISNTKAPQHVIENWKLKRRPDLGPR